MGIPAAVGEAGEKGGIRGYGLHHIQGSQQHFGMGVDVAPRKEEGFCLLYRGRRGEVMELVRGASEPDKSLAWQERKQHTLDYIKEASLEERLIIGADKLHNINSMIDDYQQLGEDLWERFNGEREDQLWYYRGLVKGLCYRQDIPSTINIFTRLKNRVEAFFGLKDE